MSLTPFEHFMMSKQAVDALVPGQVGYGPNPGVTGSMDSDPLQASNTDIALMRAQQSAQPIISRPDADGGAGYSHPAPGTSPSLQMEADVQAAAKAASIVREAEAFADQCYVEIKQAGLADRAMSAGKNLAGRAGAAAQAFRGHGAPPPPAPTPGELVGQGVRGYADQLSNHASGAMDAVGQGARDLQGHAAELGNAAVAKVQEGMAATQAGVQDFASQAGEAVTKGLQYADQATRNAVSRGAAMARREPYAAVGIGAASLAAAGGAGALADHVMLNRQNEAKQASLNEAADAGRLYALQQLGLL